MHRTSIKYRVLSIKQEVLLLNCLIVKLLQTARYWLQAIVFILFAILVLFPGQVAARTKAATPSAVIKTSPVPTDNPSSQIQFEDLSKSTPQSPQFMNLLVINLAHTVSCMGEGISIIGQPCIGGVVSQNGKLLGMMVPANLQQQSGGGALGMIGGSLALMYSIPPTRTAEYLADLGRSIGVVKPALAQDVSGSGANIIQPVKKIWQLSRNIAYLGMTAVFIIIGFMVMFRKKLNPQTVINIQSAIPGLIIGLVLITFSYFITALVIDLSFVSTHLAGNILAAGGLANDTNAKELLDKQSILEVFDKFLTLDKVFTVSQTTAKTFSFLEHGIVHTLVVGLTAFLGCKMGAAFGPLITTGLSAAAAATGVGLPAALVGGALAPFLQGTIGCTVGGAIGAIIGITGAAQFLLYWFIGLLLYLVLLTALLIAMFKVFFTIIQSYVSIIILTITAPLRFLLGSIPGNKGGFTPWLKELSAHLLIFPAYYLTFFLAAYILGDGSSIGEAFGITNGPTTKDFSGGAIPFLAGSGGSALLQVALGYGILLLTPNLADMIKAALGVKDPGYGKMVMGAFATGFAPFRKAASPLIAIREQVAKEKTQQRAGNLTGYIGWLNTRRNANLASGNIGRIAVGAAQGLASGIVKNVTGK